MHWSSQLTLEVFGVGVVGLIAWLAYWSNPRLDRAIAWIDAGMTITMIALTILAVYAWHDAPQDAERTGNFEDIGVFWQMWLTFYSVPGAILSALAGGMMWARLPPRYFLQAIATFAVLWWWVLVIVDLINDYV
jgi:hypothetical protein